jgi:hypothetical protein
MRVLPGSETIKTQPRLGENRGVLTLLSTDHTPAFSYEGFVLAEIIGRAERLRLELAPIRSDGKNGILAVVCVEFYLSVPGTYFVA